MDLSIIIVNWNSKNYLRQCISSIAETTNGIEYEIVVIDGGSFDGCGEMLRNAYPWAEFIQSEKNIGFARANNEGFKVSKGRNILFLNPDTEIERDAILELLSHLEAIPNAGAVGARLLNSDRSIQTSCVTSFPTILNQVLDAEALRKRFPRSSLWGMAPLFYGVIMPVEVDAVSGACLMIKRSVFETVEQFSTDYFMYSEDIDLCYKVQKAGWKTYYVPKATIIHLGGGSSARSEVAIFSSVMMLESCLRFFRKNRSNRYSYCYRLAMSLASIVRIGLILLMWPGSRQSGRVSLHKASLKKWFANFRWSLGYEKWVRNY